MPLLESARKRLPEKDGKLYSRARTKVLLHVTKACEVELTHWRRVLNTTTNPQEIFEAMRRVPGLCKDLGVDCTKEMQTYSRLYYRLEHMARARVCIACLRDPFVRLHNVYILQGVVRDLRRRLRMGNFTLSEIGSSKVELRAISQQHANTRSGRRGSSCAEEWLAQATYTLILCELDVRKGQEGHYAYWPYWENERWNGHFMSLEARNEMPATLDKVLNFMKENSVDLEELGLTQIDVRRLRTRFKKLRQSTL